MFTCTKVVIKTEKKNCGGIIGRKRQEMGDGMNNYVVTVFTSFCWNKFFEGDSNEPTYPTTSD